MIVAMGEESNCLACATHLADLGRRTDARYGVCPRCGSVQLLEIPDEESLSALYKDSYHSDGHYHESAEEHRVTRARVCQQVVSLVAQGRNAHEDGLVVELGAGWGNLGRLFLDQNIPYKGIEPNTVMVQAARELGLDVEQGSVSDLTDLDTGGAPVQTIVSMAVFEHLAEPERELLRMAERVSSHGRIVLQCPTAGIPRVLGPMFKFGGRDRELPGFFGSLAPPWHVFLPSPQGLRILAERCGLRVTQVVPSLSGRASDARRFLQGGNELVARVGHAAFGESWPLSMAHVFVLERLNERELSRTKNAGEELRQR